MNFFCNFKENVILELIFMVLVASRVTYHREPVSSLHRVGAVAFSKLAQSSRLDILGQAWLSAR